MIVPECLITDSGHRSQLRVILGMPYEIIGSTRTYHKLNTGCRGIDGDSVIVASGGAIHRRPGTWRLNTIAQGRFDFSLRDKRTSVKAVCSRWGRSWNRHLIR